MIVNRDGRYGVVVYDPATKGKRWVGTFASRREAKDAEREASRRRVSWTRLTGEELAVLWLSHHPRAAVATQRNYKYALQKFRQDFGRSRLSDLDRVTARAWALAQPQSNVRAVRAMFNDAINDGLHPGPNPFAGLRLEQPRGRKDLIALKEVELQALADKALAVLGDYGPTFRAMILFAGYVGLRRVSCSHWSEATCVQTRLSSARVLTAPASSSCRRTIGSGSSFFRLLLGRRSLM